MDTNVLDWLEVTAAACPDKPAFLDEDGAVTFADVRREARIIGTAAARLRAGRKAPIAVMSGRNAHTPAVFLGAVYAGCCYAPMDGTMPVHRLNSILNTLDTDLMIVQRAFYDKARTLEFSGEILIAEDLLEGCEDAALLADCRARARELDPLYIIFTSGSTGTPKGVITAQHSLMCYIEDYAGTYVLLAALVYALQLYADFSGGIDISRGVAQMFGITMGENFRRPYFSRTLTEYWHRWHISLGDWLRNYLFYPLSISKAFLNWGRHARQHLGSHIGKVLPTAVASLITFLIIGIWHGASWKYVAFGFWNGMVILVSTLLQPVSDKVVAALHIERKSAWYQVFSMLRTFVVVLIGYYFDIADGFRAAMGMMLKSVTDLHLSQLRPGAVLEALPLTRYDWAVLLFGTLVIFTASVIQERSQRTIREILDEKCLALRWAMLLAGIFAVVLMGVYGPGVQASEFVYMQF